MWHIKVHVAQCEEGRNNFALLKFVIPTKQETTMHFQSPILQYNIEISATTLALSTSNCWSSSQTWEICLRLNSKYRNKSWYNVYVPLSTEKSAKNLTSLLLLADSMPTISGGLSWLAANSWFAGKQNFSYFSHQRKIKYGIVFLEGGWWSILWRRGRLRVE